MRRTQWKVWTLKGRRSSTSLEKRTLISSKSSGSSFLPVPLLPSLKNNIINSLSLVMNSSKTKTLLNNIILITILKIISSIKISKASNFQIIIYHFLILIIVLTMAYKIIKIVYYLDQNNYNINECLFINFQKHK